MQGKPSNKSSMRINNLAFESHDTKPSRVNELHNYMYTTPHFINNNTINKLPSNYNAPTIYQRIPNSTENLF